MEAIIMLICCMIFFSLNNLDAPTYASRRFLHARSYDPQAAYKQYSASAVWRRNYKLDETYDDADIHKFGRMNRVVSQSPTPKPHPKPT